MPALDIQQYHQDIEQWHARRVAALASDSGWLSLAGLFWLEPGTQTFGAHADNDVVFPPGDVPDHIGSISVANGSAKVQINDDVVVLHNGEPVTEMHLDMSAAIPAEMTLGSLTWFVMAREGGRLAIRLRDSNHPQLQSFTGVDRYPVDPRWRVQATVVPYAPPKILQVPTVYGTVREQPSPGALRFTVDGQEYQLDPVDGEKLFVMFADTTNVSTTYGAGRFLYVDPPGPDGISVLDFNKAYNPPCAFTEFATCPLPPAQNRLALAVTAGETRVTTAGH